jgi:hypothetical protein
MLNVSMQTEGACPWWSQWHTAGSVGEVGWLRTYALSHTPACGLTLLCSSGSTLDASRAMEGGLAEWEVLAGRRGVPGLLRMLGGCSTRPYANGAS